MKIIKNHVILFLSITLFLSCVAVFSDDETTPQASAKTTPANKSAAPKTVSASSKTASPDESGAPKAMPVKHESILGSRKIVTESDKKIVKIEEIIYSFVDKGSNIDSDDVKKQILETVAAIYSLNKAKVAKKVDSGAIEKAAAVAAIEKYPLSDTQLNEKLTMEANEKYRLAKYEEQVTVVFNQGPLRKTISGNFHGLNRDKDGIKIEDYIVPIYDLSDTDKAKFDGNFMNLKKKQYISSRKEKYLSDKSTLRLMTIRDITESLTRQNEDAGFIFAWKKWRSPEDVTNILIKWVSDRLKEKRQKSGEKSLSVMEMSPNEPAE